MTDNLDPIAPKQPTVIAFGTIKGRTPRTLTASLLAEAVAQRGLRVLVVDSSLSSENLGATWHVPPGGPSFQRAKAESPADWASPEVLRTLVHHAASDVALLLAREEGAQQGVDLTLNEWMALMSGVRTLSEYDLVIVDIDTDTPHYPYLLMNTRANDWLLLALAPDDKERVRALAALKWLGFGAGGDQLLPPLLAYLERHEDDHREIERMQRNIRQEIPQAHTLGTVPRAPRQVIPSAPGGYESVLTLAPTSPLAIALQELAKRLCELAGIGKAGQAQL